MICRNHRQSKEINKNIIKPFLFLSHFVLFGSLVLKLQGTVTETVTYKISTDKLYTLKKKSSKVTLLVVLILFFPLFERFIHELHGFGDNDK